MKLNKFTSLALLSLFSFSAHALESDFDQPIHVSSVAQHAKMKANTITFSGDVVLTQGSIKITADKLTVIRGEKANQEVMIAEGNVATFHQMQDDGKPLDAQANIVKYEVAKGKITLDKNAQVKQLDSQINGSKIVYFIETEELNVTTDQTSKQRVQTVFLPAQFQKDKADNKTSKETKEENK